MAGAPITLNRWLAAVHAVASDAGDGAIETNGGVVSDGGDPAKESLKVDDASEVVQASSTLSDYSFYIVNLQSQLRAAVELKDESRN